MQLYNASNKSVISSQVLTAHSFFARLKGLLGRDGLDKDTCMVIYPCNSVHTCFMKFAIDVIFLDRSHKVLKVMADIKPFKASPIVGRAYYVVEMASRPNIKDIIHEGDQLEIRS